MRLIRIALLVGVVLVIVESLAGTSAQASAAHHRPVPFQRGVTIADWGAGAYGESGYHKLVISLKRRGVNTVTLLVDWRQNAKDSVKITPDSVATVSTARLVKAIKTARAAHLRVILKPYIDLRSSTSWRGAITPRSVPQWFESYDAYIVRYARLAQKEHVEGFVVGTEMDSMQRYADRWRALVQKVMHVYKSGFVTYQANHGSERITWWDALDAIDISAYYPLNTSGSYAVPALVKGWSNPYHLLASLHRRYHLPVMLGELGYTPYTGTFAEPWATQPLGTYSTAAQANGYTAAFQVWYPVPFFKGFDWWYVSSNPALRSTQGGNDEPRAPALRVLRHWYRNRKPAGS